MLTNHIKDSINSLSSFDKALLIQYIYDSLNEGEDPEILQEWVGESIERLKAVKEKKLETLDYSELKNMIK